MVASGHPLASLAGVQTLAAGGNALDAVVSAAAVTWVTLPMMCGPGGDAFLLLYESGSGELTGIGAGGMAPREVSREYFLERGYRSMPLVGPHAVGVPGVIGVIDEAMRRFGTMGLEQLWARAIQLAEHGFPMNRKVASWFSDADAILSGDPESARIYLPSGQPPYEGVVLTQADLAQTIRRIAAGGADEFYRGALAEQIVSCIRDHGGVMTVEDFAALQVDTSTPIPVTYRDCTIHQPAPPSQGFVHLETMKILEGFDPAELGRRSDLLIHLAVEANKLAVADRLRTAGDPLQVEWSVRDLLSDEHAAAQRSRIDPDRALTARQEHAPGDTTYLCAVDRDGSAVSFVHSLSHRFGAAMTVPGTGVLLNNRVGRGFTLEEGHPNCIAPRKRTMSTLNCYRVTSGDRLRIVGGTPGGDGQVQWNSQVLIRLLDQGFDTQGAVDAVRWTRSPSTDPATLGDPETLTVERRISPRAARRLEQRGHRVRMVGAYAAGGDAQVIQVDEGGVCWGGSDRRGDGVALGL